MTETSIAVQSEGQRGLLVERTWFKRSITALIVASAILLGVETMRELPVNVLETVFYLNRVILMVFVVELTLRVAAYKRSFFTDAWNWFDFLIVVISVAMPSGPFQVLRAMRILRVLRLVSSVSSLRRVVDGLIRAVPGIASVMVLLVLLLYVTSVMATLLFREISPDDFGHLGASMFSLFQVMTLEGWSGIARDVMAVQPWAWVFFITYILIASFLVVNLVIGIVVSAIQTNIEEEMQEIEEGIAEDAKVDQRLLTELRALRAEVREYRDEVGKS